PSSSGAPRGRPSSKELIGMSSRTIFFALAVSIVLFVTVGLLTTGPGAPSAINAANARAAAPAGSGANLAAPAAPPAAPAAPDPNPRPAAAAPAQLAPSAAPAGSCGGSSGGCGCMRLAPRPSAAPAPSSPPPVQTGASGAQVVFVRAEIYGYDHPALQVKSGQPVEFHFSASPLAGCGRQLILDGFNVNLVSQSGEDEVATFTPASPGTYAYHCGMNMFRGTLQVV
ncbi:MAG: cupredoxin domain-containing protein, partial [Candidatus Micrarchaeota archaeon]|nr:cupredoxin domain-containing protein [Candidatus Micrarchaeota archaeon]